MAILALHASLGSLHIAILDTWVSYDVAYGHPCPGDAPGAVEPLVMEWNHGYEWRSTCAGKSLLTHFLMEHLVGAAPRSVPTQQTVHIVAPTLQLLTIS